MSRFQDAYREAVESLPEFHGDAGWTDSGVAHRRFLSDRRRRGLAAFGTAAALFLLCGAGTAFALNCRRGEIRVNDTGFTVTGWQDDGAQSAAAGEENAKMKTGGVSMSRKEAPDEAAGMQDCEAEAAEYSMAEPVEYGSVEEFLAAETVAVPLPDWSLFDTEFSEQNVIVAEDSVTILMMGEGKYFRLDQQDHRAAVAYSVGTAYMGESRNERTYTNSQGFDFVVFDTVDEEETKVTHAVISVNGRDLTLDFSGFSGDVTEEVLNTLDLSVYFVD